MDTIAEVTATEYRKMSDQYEYSFLFSYFVCETLLTEINEHQKRTYD